MANQLNRTTALIGSEEETSDLELMRLVLKHNTTAFSILFKRYSSRGISLAQRMGMDYESAQDIVAESFIKIWNQARDFEPKRGKFSSWFFTIVHNLTVDEMRRRHSRARAAQRVTNEYLVNVRQHTSEVTFFTNLEQVHVHAALKQLPEAQRQVVQLAYLEGLSRREIAKQLALPVGTVHTRVRVGLMHLAQLLRDDHQPEEAHANIEAVRPMAMA